MTESFQPAGVLVPAIVIHDDILLIFTKRSDEVQHHKGQICFPGGTIENDDSSLWHTALRETEEEIGIASQHIIFICSLPKLKTPTFFEISPFLGLIHKDAKLIANPREIDTIFMAPLSHFLNKKNLQFEEKTYFNKTFQSPKFTYKEHVIWGATGKILFDLVQQFNS